MKLEAFPHAPRFKRIYSLTAGDWAEDIPGLFQAFVLKKERYYKYNQRISFLNYTP
jgi:hypothetical protein